MPQQIPLDDLVAALPLPTLAIGADERIASLNEPAQKMLKTPAKGRHFVTILRQPALVEAVERCLVDDIRRDAQFVLAGSENDVTYDVTLQRIANSETVLLSFYDVTRLEQAEQMRRDFVANVSHELRTPLTALMGFIETLRGPAQDDASARERFLGIMSGEAERMNRLVGDLLSLSRVESEARVRPKDLIDLRDVLNATLRNLAPLAVDNAVTLRPEFGTEQLYVLGDADQMVQVCTNLIENAIKYGGQNKPIDIKASVEENVTGMRGKAICIAVKDYGPGIEQHHLPRLTERFYRADSHRSRSLGGTGLGLAIVKHIVNRHRGRLRVHSELGQGATFIVVLPKSAMGVSSSPDE